MSTRSMLPLLALLLTAPTGAQSLPEIDLDRDGYPAVPALGTDTVADCNDGEAGINPGVLEIWYDGVDQDCDGGSDDDADKDGYAAIDRSGTDCDDKDAAVHPGADETWYDGMDQDCAADDDFDQDGDGERWTMYASNRHDSTGMNDCDDTNAAVHSDGFEVASDGIDNDCDGKVE